MPYLAVGPDDAELIAQAVELTNLARAVDDPEALPADPTLQSRYLRYGWDLEPDQMHLYRPDGAERAVGLLELGFPRRDNRHLAWAAITVHPEHRRSGHGRTMLDEAVRRARAEGRTTMWVEAPEDDLGSKAFAERFGFRFASHDARRRQLLAEVDRAGVDLLHTEALRAAADYELERGTLPTPDDVLEELVDVTAAINDAPMGELTFEDEHFDLRRLQDFEEATAGRQDRGYRIWARHRDTGEVAGHTLVVVNPLRPQRGVQADTAVSRSHRGHRLGLLLKVEMMRWLAEVEPQLEVIETWNNVDNGYMIRVNEAIGYRLSRVFATYERTLGGAQQAQPGERA